MTKNRCRFLVFTLEQNLDQMADTFNSHQFSEQDLVGVNTESLTHSEMTIKYIEKKTIYDQVQYPNGETETIERFTYIYSDICIKKIVGSYYLFHIINPPSSIKSFVGFIVRIFPSISLEKFTFSLRKFRSQLVKNWRAKNCRVTRLNASSIPFTDKSVAKVEIFSEIDAYKEFKKIYSEKSIRLDRLVFSVFAGQRHMELTASSTGLISYDKNLDEASVVESFLESITY